MRVFVFAFRLARREGVCQLLGNSASKRVCSLRLLECSAQTLSAFGFSVFWACPVLRLHASREGSKEANWLGESR